MDEKIYTQTDLNNAVTNAINEMTIVLDRKNEEIENLRLALKAKEGVKQ